jgi:hypothetical protein
MKLYSLANVRLLNNGDNYSNNSLQPTNNPTYQIYPDYQTYIYANIDEHNINNNQNNSEVLPKYSEIIVDNDTLTQPPLYTQTNAETNKQTNI